MTELAAGMAIVPLGEAQIGRLVRKSRRERVRGFGDLTIGLERALASLATRGAFAYVETEYFGGTGGQGAVVFSPRRVPVRFTDEHQPNPINSALKSLGVKAHPGDDEFDTLGLGRFRTLKNLGLTYDWVPEEPSPVDVSSPSSTADPGQPRRRRAAALVRSVIALTVLVAIFWVGITLAVNAGFDFALP